MKLLAQVAKWLGGRSAARIRPEQVPDLQTAGAILLDVRTPHEFNTGHAPRARNIPLDTIPARLRDLPADRKILTICQSGGRSARAASTLRAHGHDVLDVKGGMSAWQRAGLPVEPIRR